MVVIRGTRTWTGNPLGIAITGGIIGALLIGFGIFSHYRGNDLAELEENGIRVQGEVIDSRKDTRTETYYSDGRRRTRTRTEYYVSCRFEHEGRRINDRIEVGSGTYGKFTRATPQSPVPATYIVAPWNSSEWMLQDDLQEEKSSSNLMGWLLPVIGMFVLGGAGAGAYFAHRKRQNTPAHVAGYGTQPPPNPQPQVYPQPRAYPQPPGQAAPPNNQDNVLYDENQPENKHQPPPWQV